MIELTAENAARYLLDTGRVPAGAVVRVRELTGGVSNVVLRVDVEGPGEPFIVKQCRERLRVAMEWTAPLERIWTERAALGVLEDLVPRGRVPEVLFEDRPEYLFAMSCAPEGSATWKERLMGGRLEAEVAREVGRLLGAIHARASGHPALAAGGALADAGLFDALRVDPYYRTTAIAHPDLAGPIDRLIDAMPDAPDRTFVHGDFSPKNILVNDAGGLVLLDFECAHAGDPAFDLGFVLSHLVLKAFRAARLGGDSGAVLALASSLWGAYAGAAGIDPAGDRARRASLHTAACLLARLDGKSPVEYRHELDQDAVRRLAREVLARDREPAAIEGLLHRVAGCIG